jgi:predicted RNA-binding Zn-ribbon protein involved in translation (DUF1610 family)
VSADDRNPVNVVFKNVVTSGPHVPVEPDLRTWLIAALAKFDSASASCPFQRKGRKPAVDKPCPQCGATKSQTCRVDVQAAFALVKTVREAVK